MMLSPGTKFGAFQILSQLGAGGMGEVYLAEDTRLHRKVALKVLPAEVASNQDRMRRFNQEAQAAAALNHPNIAHIYEIGESQGTHFIAMEYVEGETLGEKIHREKAPLVKLLRYLAQVAEGLSKAHAAGIVHRDLKPDNIMVTRDGYAKILDFGLAKLIEPTGQSSGQKPDREGGLQSEPGSSEIATAVMPLHSTPGMIMGTVGYMSPEQAQGRLKEIDHRSDIFSFGCILYEAATGRKAFEGKDVLDSLHMIVHAPTPQIKDVNSLAPDELQRIVRRCLAKEPDKRYQSIKDVAIELDEIRQELKSLAEVEGSIQPTASVVAASGSSTQADVKSAHQSAIGTTQHDVARPTSSAEYVTSEIKKHKSVSIAVLAILLLAVGGLGFWYFSNRLSNTLQIESIAVLPFVNESGNSEMEYLSDGMTESLITSLSQLPKLNVKARSSVFRYKGKEVEPRKVGAELSVQAVLLGRVVQRGNDLTLYIELVDANTENTLWKADYNRSMTNLVSLQSEIARDVSNKLRQKLSSPDEQKLAKNSTENAEAYQLYFKGRYQLNRASEEGYERSIDYFQQAIALDPNYAQAYAGIADGYILAADWYLSNREAMAKAKPAATRALEIDDTLAEAHASMGTVRMFYDWNWSEAEKEYRRAIELNPNHADARQWYSLYLSVRGRHSESIAEARQAQQLDPFSLNASMKLAEALFHARQYDQAIEQLRKTLELDQNFWWAHQMLGEVYERKGQFTEAIAALLNARQLDNNPLILGKLGRAFARSGKRAEAQKLIDELKELSKQRYVSSNFVAGIYAALGERDTAFKWLEKGYEERSIEMVFLKIDPLWDDLRPDPRFQELLRQVGLPQ